MLYVNHLNKAFKGASCILNFDLTFLNPSRIREKLKLRRKEKSKGMFGKP